MKKIKVGILGYGTVGSGTHEILTKNHDLIQKRTGVSVEVVRILRRKPSDSHLFTDDPDVILNDPDIDLIVEVIGGIEPAASFMLTAMKNGKHVVTANKAAVAANYKVLTETAEENDVDFLFEAAVAGGIPVLTAIQNPLQGNNFLEVMGILNGTTNYILTKMTEDGASYADVLKDAQEKGFAEADPTADVEGLDAGRKVAILASAAFNSRVTFEDVYTEGITKITATDIQYAKEMGCTIKLLGVAKDTPEGIEARVHPMLIDSNHPLATVNDSYNAVFLTGDAVQDTMFYGRGAGELPTASAVVGDIFDVVRNILWNCCGRIGCTCYRECPIKRVGEIKSKYFVRMQIENRYGTLASVASVFGNNKVSIAQMLQKRVNGKYAEIVVITDEVKERHFEDAMQILGGMSMIQEISSTIRVY